MTQDRPELTMKIGSNYLGDGRCEFTVWAPYRKEVAVEIISPEERLIPMEQDEEGYWKVTAEGIKPETLYFYQLDGSLERPDPASHFQPEGVHGPSQVVDHHRMKWADAGWSGIPLEEMIIYELHVGTFTPEGTFEGIIPRLKELQELGVNAIEIMPIAQFPGNRNWGYDGAYLYGVQNSYGGPEALKHLVDACHQQGIAVILDVVYNHFGPEGNYIGDYGPYYTATYRTPWGNAINFDNVRSDGVRNFFIENALYWFENYHIDALRLDAVHAIYDLGAKHILYDLSERVDTLCEKLGKKLYLIAESDLNDVRIIRDRSLGGHGIDAQWSDDFHHVLHALVTGENAGYYQDFGKGEQLAKAYKETFVYSWNFSQHRQRYHGNDASEFPGHKFVVCIQNHDQVGNRMLGERLTHLVSFDALKLAAGAMLLSPNIPMLFMGEEYGEESPFLYFVSHTDQNLVEAVRTGRREEFKDFHLEGEFQDPFSYVTFFKSKLKWQRRQEGKHKVLWDLYQHLIQLRRTLPALKKLDKQNLEACCNDTGKVVQVRRWTEDNQVFFVLNFSEKEVTFKPVAPSGNWNKILSSADDKWMGSGCLLPEKLADEQELTIRPQSFALFSQ